MVYDKGQIVYIQVCYQPYEIVTQQFLSSGKELLVIGLSVGQSVGRLVRRSVRQKKCQKNVYSLKMTFLSKT